MKIVAFAQHPESRLINKTKRVRLAGESTDGIFDKRSATLFALIAIVYAAARAWQLTSFGLYADEAFTLQITRADWRTLTDLIIADVVHPPLFYYLLKLWMIAGGESLLWLKLFPFLTSLAIVAPFYLLCRELKPKPKAINLALWLMAVNNFLVFYAQELRMYDLLLLFALTSLWLFARLINRDENEKLAQLALFAVNLLLIYTHYYGWLIVGVEFLLLLTLKRERLFGFTIALVLLIACFTPWAIFIAEAAAQKGGLDSNLGWNRAPTPAHFIEFYALTSGAIEERLQAVSSFFTVFVLAVEAMMIILWIPVAAWSRRVIKNRHADREQFNALLFLAAFSFLPTIASFIASHTLSQSVWSNRYLISSAPVFLILQAAAYTSLDKTRLVRAAAICLIAISGVSGLAQMHYCNRVSYELLVGELIKSKPQRDGVIKVFSDYKNIASTIQFYLGELKETELEAQYVADYREVDEEFFYIAFMTYRPEERAKIESDIALRGFMFGDEIKARGPTFEVVILPVFRQSNGPRLKPLY